jgi:uncharacterized protein (TIGR00251 family)
VRVRPRASRSEISGETGGALKVKIAAPPVDGKANEECRRFLAELLKIPKRDVEIIAGETASVKIIRFSNVDVERVSRALTPGYQPAVQNLERSIGS